MVRSARAYFVGFLLVVAACSNNTSPSGDDDSSTIDAGGPPDALVPPADSYTLSWGPVNVQPGDENTQCVTLRLKNVPRIHVHQIHNQLSEGSHHLIVYRTSETVEKPTPYACQPFVDTIDPSKGSPLMITQRRDELLELPEGVAFTLDPNQMIRLEMHYINTGDTALDVTATSTFIPISEAEFHDEGDFLFVGSPDIDLPPGQSSTVGPTFFAMPPDFAAVNFFAITGHTHRFGTNVHVAASTGVGDPGMPVYEHTTWVWSEPQTEYFTPPFHIPANGGFRFSCEYNNTSTARVHFGESATDEMCFFWAYYYPSQGAQVCVQSDKFGLGGCCPYSTFVCNAIKAYLGQ